MLNIRETGVWYFHLYEVKFNVKCIIIIMRNGFVLYMIEGIINNKIKAGRNIYVTPKRYQNIESKNFKVIKFKKKKRNDYFCL